jgi:predicted RNase H-like HicB family nuclease
MTYDFVTWQEDRIWSSHAPSVAGVYGLGSTAARAERDLMEALETMSEYLNRLGERLPRARTVRLGKVRI